MAHGTSPLKTQLNLVKKKTYFLLIEQRSDDSSHISEVVRAYYCSSTKSQDKKKIKSWKLSTTQPW